MTVGELKLIELTKELMLFKGNKFIELDLEYKKGMLLVEGSLKQRGKNKEFSLLFDLEEIQELTVQEFNKLIMTRGK